MRRRLLVAAPFIAMTLAAGLCLGGTVVAAVGVHSHHVLLANELNHG